MNLSNIDKRPPIRISQKDINEDYDTPRNSLQRPPDPAFNDRKLPPMIEMAPPAANILPPAKSKKGKPPPAPTTRQTRSQSQRYADSYIMYGDEGYIKPTKNYPGSGYKMEGYGCRNCG